MEQARFDIVRKFTTHLGSRRSALAVAAASGLALTGHSTSAKDNGVAADGKKRGRRGKRGKRGHTGPSGPPSGADVQIISETCLLPAEGETPQVGDVAECVAACPDGFVASGGGHQGPTFIDALGFLRSSFPDQQGGSPVGWVTQVEFLDIGQEFNVTTYAVCLPA
jgi:hypothetical protein